MTTATPNISNPTDLEALPPLDSDYALEPSAIAGYQRDGHVLLRNVATPSEVEVYGPIIEETTRRYVGDLAPLEERDTYGKAFWQITNLWQRDAQAARFTLARRFAKIAADLMGVDGVRLYHDQALFKEPGGGPTPWHQDQFYWPLSTDKTITLWMPLVDASPEMGTLRFASGSQRDGYQGEFSISDESQRIFEQLVKDNGYGSWEPHAMQAGDASFHSGWTLHSAPGNASQNLRSVMTIIYYADGSIISEPDSEFRRNDLEAWFPGQKPGEVAGSDINPLVYSR